MSGCITAEPESSPPELAVVGIADRPYQPGIGGKTNIAVGSQLAGFVVTKYTPKFETRTLPSGSVVTVDVSELTLMRGDRTTTLLKNRTVGYVEHVVRLVDRSGGKDGNDKRGGKA